MNEIWVAVNAKGKELIFNDKPTRYIISGVWECPLFPNRYIRVPKGFIKSHFNIDLTWNDDPVRVL